MQLLFVEFIILGFGGAKKSDAGKTTRRMADIMG